SVDCGTSNGMLLIISAAVSCIHTHLHSVASTTVTPLWRLVLLVGSVHRARHSQLLEDVSCLPVHTREQHRESIAGNCASSLHLDDANKFSSRRLFRPGQQPLHRLVNQFLQRFKEFIVAD